MPKTYIRKIFIALILSCCMAATASANAWNGVVGFATYSALGLNGVTGGGSGEVVHVSTRADLARYAGSAAPYVIIIDKDITGGGMQDLQDEVSVASDKTIIGSGAGKALNGIALVAANRHNIIIRNISLKKGRIDGMAFENCHHVWIDHCDLSDSYDGLLDITKGSDFFTVSWVKLHDHNKVSITNSGTCHYEDYNRERVTFAHCMFQNNTQRNPRIGYGKMHIYNGYWEKISSYCIGFHSQAQVLSENNHFSSSASNPFNNQYTDKLPYCGYLTDRGSYFAKGDPGKTYSHAFTDISYTPLDYYDYDFDLDNTADVVTNTPKGAGPRDGIQHEPILNPGNGAKDVPLTQRLSWGAVDGASSTEMYFGTSADNLQPAAPSAVRLAVSTRYYWRVKAVVGGKEYWSPLYTFTTGGAKASKPSPQDGETKPWLRTPYSGTEFCGSMPLCWRPAADAVKYRVWLSTSETQLGTSPVGETTTLSINPGHLSVGKRYFWRVDAVRQDGTVTEGDTWTFSTDAATWAEGKNQAEKLYYTAIAFSELNGSASGRYNVVGDQGPGAILGTWGGPEGRYAIETAVFNQTLGANYVGVAVNDKLVDAWHTADTDNNIALRKTRHTVMLKPGDEIRIDFVAGLVDGKTNQSRCRIDYVNINPATADVVEAPRPSGKHHVPGMTPGYDCEYLTMKNILFKDSLGTVGDYGAVQVKDKYCQWVTRESDARYIFYLAQTAIVKLVYRDASGAETVVTKELDKTQNTDLAVPSTDGGAALYAVMLYKREPTKTIYYKPVAAAGKDYELVWSPDVVFKDVNGIKGVAGKVQIRDAYEEWIKYNNPTANEVQAKEGVNAYIDPATDKERTFVPKGADGNTFSYVAGAEKYITYHIQGCSRMKLYYTGSAGTATSVRVTVADLDSGEERDFEGDEAKGKNAASAVAETELNPGHRYAVRVSASQGDMVVYAVKMWPGEPTGIEGVTADDDSAKRTGNPAYNLAGQRVSEGYKGVVIQGKRKILK